MLSDVIQILLNVYFMYPHSQKVAKYYGDFCMYNNCLYTKTMEINCSLLKWQAI